VTFARCPHCGRDEEAAHYAQPDINPRPNNPPPDELAAVRSEIKRLEERETELKRLLLDNPDVRTGASWLAEVKTVDTTRLDVKELRANHADILDQYTFQVPVTRVVLSGISDEGEIVSARRFRNETRT
jgi:hypothetical protein